MFKKTLLIIVFLSISLSSLALASVSNLKILHMNITNEEFKSLPDFLQDRVMYHNTNNSIYSRKWTASLGVDYIHYHHWASGIILFQRAMDPKNFVNRNYLLNGTIGEYNYLLRHCLPKNQFRYIFHLRKGEIYYIQERYSDAANELQMSLNYKNDHEQTYIVLSKTFEALGMNEQALETMQKANSLKVK